MRLACCIEPNRRPKHNPRHQRFERMRRKQPKRATLFTLLLMSCQTESGARTPLDSGVRTEIEDARTGSSSVTDARIGDDKGRAPEASNPGPANMTATFVRLGANDRCLPDAIPITSGTNLTACRILLDGVSAGCGQPGLASVSADDVALVRSALMAVRGTPPSGAVCELRQVAPSSTKNTG